MIFILGGQGFVGSAFVRFCVGNDLAFRVLNRDNYYDFKDSSCDYLINASGNPKKYLANEKPGTDFEASCLSTVRSLNDFKYKHYIQISSVDVYPETDDYEKTREWAAMDMQKQNHYGFHKAMAELAVIHYAPRWTIYRLGGLVGPGLKKNPIYDMLNVLPLMVNVESKMTFIHTDSVAQIVMMTAMSQIGAGEIYNVAAREPMSIASIAPSTGMPAIGVSANKPITDYLINTEKISLSYGQLMPTTEESLELYFQELRQYDECKQ